MIHRIHGNDVATAGVAASLPNKRVCGDDARNRLTFRFRRVKRLLLRGKCRFEAFGTYGSSKTDVCGIGTQLNGSSRLHSLNEVVSEDECGFEIFELQDGISRGHEDPATVAARNLDWDLLLAGLSHIEQMVVEFLGAGKTLRDVGRQLGLSDSTMQNYRRKLAVKILECMGADVLHDIVIAPGWRINLDCERESQACRNDRRACSVSA